MKRLFRYTCLACIIFLFGCSDNSLSDYDNDDIVAIVRGEEITVGDLRFLYPDDKALENLPGTVKAKLAEQEVKRMNLDISHELQEIQDTKKVMGNYPPEEDDSEIANGTREFADAQSAKFGMTPEEYYEKYFEKSQEMSIYVIAFIEEILGEPDGSGEEYTKKANALLDDLVDDNEDEIRILIK
ncbi:hypothetical protein [Oceanobacillus manasiensis]|uniref:hypothetical protein n=1 Tax=Oceanobacillus manasiensis TaxID=586413 RepID=UPI0005A6B625|nr:hypothetical protein [Oceanobacillus manasiensis]